MRAITGPPTSEKSPGLRLFKSGRRRQQAGILALDQPQDLDIGEEEGLVLSDASAQAAAELVLPELRAPDAGAVGKEVIGIQLVVAEVFVQLRRGTRWCPTW